MDKKIQNQYKSMVLDNVLQQNTKNIQLEATINRALADKITTDAINTKVNSKLNAINVEIKNINPKYNEESRNYAETKAEILDALTNYESALLELSDLFDKQIENLILEKVELEAKKLGMLMKDECLVERVEKKANEKENLTSKITKGVKELAEKISFKNQNKEKEYIDVSLYSKAQDVEDIKIEVDTKMEDRVLKAKEDFNQNVDEIKKVEERIKKIDIEINNINKRKTNCLMNAMEKSEKWIAVSVRKPRTVTKIKRFFLSKFNTTKMIHKNVITPLNNLVKEFRETELVELKG
jgi:hypothetical protein